MEPQRFQEQRIIPSEINTVFLSDYQTNLHDGILNVELKPNTINYCTNNTTNSSIYDFTNVLNIPRSDDGGQSYVSLSCVVFNPIDKCYYFGGFTRGILDSFGNIVYSIVKWDGENTWYALGEGLSGQSEGQVQVFCLACDSQGNIYAGGQFLRSGNMPLYYIAKWDGNNWSALGNGVNSEVSAIAIDSNDNIYIGGPRITSTFDGSTSLTPICKWNGLYWESLPGLEVGRIEYFAPLTAVVIDSYGNIYASGKLYLYDEFNNPYFVPIAKWNGQLWTNISNGLTTIQDGRCNSLVIDSYDNLYAFGDFYVTENCYYIAKWNGINWLPLSNGFINNGTTPSAQLSMINNVLYVGGSFLIKEGNFEIKNKSKWENNTWSKLGTYINLSVPVSYFINYKNNNLYFCSNTLLMEYLPTLSLYVNNKYINTLFINQTININVTNLGVPYSDGTLY
jgi:hypothetical protein